MDLIDRMIHRLRHIEPRLSPEKAEALEQRLREEFGGVSTKTRKRSKTKKQEVEAALHVEFRGNVDDFARQLGCHRSTVYRVLSSRKSIRKM